MTARIAWIQKMTLASFTSALQVSWEIQMCYINICNAHKTTPKKYFLYRSCKAIQSYNVLQDNIFSNSNILIYATRSNHKSKHANQNKSESDGNF